MASNIPAQLRTVDPYASYNSNVVNNLTGIVTRGSNVLDYYNSLQVISDSTAPLTQVTVLTGTVYKDDMLIEITAEHTVDFTDDNQYISPGISFSGEDGIYYLVLQYTYTKSRPAPQASIKILLPSQTSSFAASSDLVFLKAVDALSGAIVALYDYDPNDTTVQREYVRTYASNDIILPTFDQERDQGRVTYVPTEDSFYLGYANGWENADSGSAFEADTTLFALGDLVRITSAGLLTKASATYAAASADGVVTKIGVKGVVQTTGRVLNVPIEAASGVATGNLLYLSSSTAGAVTRQKTSPFWQFVGRAKNVGATAEILFVRGVPEGIPEVNLSKFKLFAIPGWYTAGGYAYYDVDISDFIGRDVIVDLYHTIGSTYRFEPTDLEFLDDTEIRVWIPTPDIDLRPEVCIIGKSVATLGGADVTTVSETLTPSGPKPWTFFAAGEYYQDIDVSDILNGKAVVTVIDQATNKVIEPQNISLHNSTTIRIFMPNTTETLIVNCTGDSNVGDTNNVTWATLLEGGWTLSGGSYYHELDLSEIGMTTTDLVVGTRDYNTGLKIIVEDIEFISSSLLRIWMPVDIVDVVVTISG